MNNEPNTGSRETERNAENAGQDGETFTLISVEDYYDLLMEQQEQM